MTESKTTYIHINRGTGVHYVVAGIPRGCRKVVTIADSKSKTAAIRKAAEKMAAGNYRKIWVNHCADYYDPTTFVKLEAI